MKHILLFSWLFGTTCRCDKLYTLIEECWMKTDESWEGREKQL